MTATKDAIRAAKLLAIEKTLQSAAALCDEIAERAIHEFEDGNPEMTPEIAECMTFTAAGCAVAIRALKPEDILEEINNG